MKQIISKAGLLTIAGAVVLLAGCILISGTFVIVEPFSFTTHTGFYYYNIDITDEPDWEDHKDDIDNVDLVGFEMWFQNNSATSVSFRVYIDDPDEPVYSSFSEVDANASLILSDLKLPEGETHLTYGNSFAYVQNVEALKELVKGGEFHFYGVSTGGANPMYQVDSGMVIVTFSASK